MSKTHPAAAPASTSAYRRRRQPVEAGNKRQKRTLFYRRALAIIALAFAGVGCAYGGTDCPSSPRTASPPSSAQGAPRTAASAPVTGLLNYAHALAVGTPAKRANAVRAARRQLRQNPSAKHKARLAIALGIPAQRYYRPREAARYAQRAIDANDAHWSPTAKHYLSDHAWLYQQLASRATADKAKTHRIAQLKAQLANAHHKLRALANVENQLDSSSP